MGASSSVYFHDVSSLQTLFQPVPCRHVGRGCSQCPFLVGAKEEPPVTLNLAAVPCFPCVPISKSVTTSVWPVLLCYVETCAVTWGHVGSLVLPCKCRRVSLFLEGMVYIWFSFHYFRCPLEGLWLLLLATASKYPTCLEEHNTRDLEKCLDARCTLNCVWPSEVKR